MPAIAAWINDAITAMAKEDEAALDSIAHEIRDLLAAFPMPGWTTG
jgi:glycine hydroxymethyltransferase